MVSLIWAWDLHKLIGKNNELPWYYPQDLAYFKSITRGKIVIMGRSTYDSILQRNKKPLPNRLNVVLTHRTILEPGVIAISDLKKYINEHTDENIFVIGGKHVFEQAFPYADRLYITEINCVYEGDVYLDNLTLKNFSLVSSKEDNELRFLVYERNC